MRIPSDDKTATLHAMFPTLVYQTHLEQHSAFKAAFDELENGRFDVESGDGGKHFAGEYHGRILLHQEDALATFFETLAEKIAAYLRVLGMRAELFEMQCLKSWLVLCEPNSEDQNALVAHNHSCSDVSWVYYIDVPEDCPAIKFHTGRQLQTAPFGSAFHYDWHDKSKSAIDKINWWNSDAWSVIPKSGDLLLFPGHQLHSVDGNHTSEKRVSAAGDVALTLRDQHMKLEFGRTSRRHWRSLPLK